MPFTSASSNAELLNSYSREIEEELNALNLAKADLLGVKSLAMFTREEFEEKVRAAEARVQRARNNY